MLKWLLRLLLNEQAAALCLFHTAKNSEYIIAMN